MLAGVSSTTRIRSFMRSSDASGGGSAIEQRLRVAERIALNMALERRKVVVSQERAERGTMAFEDVRRGGIELTEVLAHLDHDRLERLGIRRLRDGRGRRRHLDAERHAKTADQSFQIAGQPLPQGFDPPRVPAAGDRLLERRRRSMN